MEAGVSATLFGFLYGTVFGLEGLIPALWMRPAENIPYLIKVTLSFGVALVSLGLILNLVNALRLKEYENLLSASGLAGALFYWVFGVVHEILLLAGGRGG
jgi:V/A-type H+-transporting ATPase subunit I